MSEIKIASFNCRGIQDYEKRKDVFAYLRNQEFNIIMLQDVHCRKIGVQLLRNCWGSDILVAPFANNARGVAILTKNIDVRFSKTHLDESGNLIVTKAKVEDSEFCLVNVYGPNSDEPDFYTSMKSLIDACIEEENLPVIIGGDFNLTLKQNEDTYNYRRENNTRARNTVKNIMSERNWIDIYRERNPDARRFTWRVGNPIVKQARLDMFIISSNLEGYVVGCGIQPGYRSDHSIVTLNIDYTTQVRGRGLFKFNVSLLRDLEYVNIVKKTIRDVACEYSLPVYSLEYVEQNPSKVQFKIDPSLFFEVLLLTIRRETVAFGIKKKRAERKREKELEKKIAKNEVEIDLSGSESLMETLQQQKKDLEGIREQKLKGSLIRSRAIWREFSEKPTKYFLTLEKRRYESKRISHIITNEGTKRTQEEILQAFKEYFEKKFRGQSRSDGTGYEEYLSDIQVKRVSAEEQSKLQKTIDVNELGTTLLRMKNGTSPGSDGFSVEFYKFFWSDLKYFFEALCNDCWEKGTITHTMKEGIIVLLPKSKKPREQIKSYRPITLLNVKYKIISGTIANRLKIALNNIIDLNQTAFLKNRYIGDNIRMIYDAIQCMANEQLSGILLSLDIESAFDSVSWDFVRKALKKYDFPSDIVKWFNVLYEGSFARILYNGHLSAEIPLSRSCRQGDALSCYLFIIVMDILGKKIQRNRNIKGLKLGSCEHKVSMYADDTVCFLEPNEGSLMALFNELGWFAKYSGLHPNLEKTKAMWIGVPFRDKTLVERQVSLTWCND